MSIKAIKGIITYKSKYLLQLRDNKKRISFPNHWGLFGGRKDGKETDISTIKREIKEETNLDINVEQKMKNRIATRAAQIAAPEERSVGPESAAERSGA